MKKIVCIGNQKTYGGRTYHVFCSIEFVDGKLSISGVEGPLQSGNALGGCGQIQDDLVESITEPGEGWSRAMIKKFVSIWSKWHLNDMRSNCIHQEARGETWENNPGTVCPVCKFKLGHAWDSREVPQDVIDWLSCLPDSKITPAWV